MKDTRSYTVMSFPIRAAALVLCVAALMSAGCSRDDSGTSIPIVIATPEPSANPVIGGTLRLPMPVNAVLNDPYGVDTEEMLGFYGLIYESLIDIDESNALVACIAETWTCDDTGKIWTVTIRSNAVWHGMESVLTAADVVHSWNRIAALGSSSHYSYVCDRVASMTAESETVLKITMKQAGLVSLYALDFPISPRSVADGSVAVGTGPYYVAYVGEDYVSLRINDNWWKTSPFIEMIQFFERDSNDTAIASYAAGQLDMVLTSVVSAGRLREEGVTKVLEARTQLAELMLFNYEAGLFGNAGIRKAIYYAIDRSAIITNIYMNHATEVDVPFPPDSWLYDSATKQYDYDVARAAALLEEAGWTDRDGDGLVENSLDTELSFTLLVNETLDNTLRREAADEVARDLLEVGITVTVVAKTHALGDDDSDFMRALEDGDFDLAMVGFSVSRDGDLTQLLTTGGERNYSGFSSEALDLLLLDITTARDEAELRAAVAAMQSEYIDELPMLVLFFRNQNIVYRYDLSGVGSVTSPDIFRTVAKWYLYTDAE